MAFKFPEKYRVRKPGNALSSDSSFGNNGAAYIEAGTEIVPDKDGRPCEVPYFLLVVASDQKGWERITIVVHSLASQRTASWEEIKALRNMFWSKEDVVIQYIPSEKYKDSSPLAIHLFRKAGVDFEMPPLELWDKEKKSGLLTVAKNILTGKDIIGEA